MAFTATDNSWLHCWYVFSGQKASPLEVSTVYGGSCGSDKVGNLGGFWAAHVLQWPVCACDGAAFCGRYDSTVPEWHEARSQPCYHV